MSRYDDIMRAIEMGFSDEDLAGMYRTDVETIAVYRKAHDGTLMLNAQYDVRQPDENEDRDETIIRMYKDGYRINMIAESTGTKFGTVRNVIYNYRRDNGIRGWLKRGKPGGNENGLADEI